jgi:thiosulfate/3-mercaptopyruvate sulfurtransferase
MNIATLVSPQSLATLLDERDVLVVDCRHDLADARRGAREYAAAHIPGAIHADLNADLCDLRKQGLGRHPLPDAADFSAVLSRWGWTPRTRVVAYDDAGGALAAARLWWMLHLAGAREAGVLDGGFKAWREGGLPIAGLPASDGTDQSSTDRLERRPATAVTVAFDATQIVYTAELQEIRDDVVLLDARAAPRFRGENETIDPVAGHIPGARNRPFAENLRPNGRFKPPSDLRAEFIAILGDTQPHNVVHSCGSGVTACHNLLAMEYAGFVGSRIYAPSWSGWISDRSRPVASGAG